MNKRLRKKRHLGEFQEFGCAVHGALRPALVGPALHAFVDRLLAIVEGRGLALGGGIDAAGQLDGYVTRDGHGSVTEADRAALTGFLASDPDVIEHAVAPLTDAWR